MRLESGPRLRQTLRQEQQPPESPFENPEFYYQSHFHQKKNLLGIQFEYVIAPHETVNRFSQEAHGFNTSLGTNIEGKIFVVDGKKNEHQSQNQINCFVQIPYAGLLLHLDKVSREELGNLIGSDKIAGKTDNQIKFIIYRAILYHAEKIMRAHDFVDFMDKFRQEQQFPENVRKAALRDLIKYKESKVQQIYTALPTLSHIQKQSHMFYVAEQRAYNDAFQKNKYVQRSRTLKSFIQQHPQADQLFGSYIIHSDGAAEDIIHHPECQENMPQVIEFVDTLIHSLKTKDEIDIDLLGGIVLYLIERHFTDTLDKKPSITPTFLYGLKRRLIGHVIAEIDKMDEALKQAPQLAASLQTDESFRTVLNQYLQSIAKPLEGSAKQFFLVPTSQTNDIVTQSMREYLLALEDAATGKAKDDKELYQILELRESTEKAGLPTDAIDTRIKNIITQQNTVFQQRVGVFTLPQSIPS